MTIKLQPAPYKPDPAAVFACAVSLWKACHDHAAHDKGVNLSEDFNGIDELMRVVMSIGSQFEEWACLHINFAELNDVWPYLLEDKFGKACLGYLPPSKLSQFNKSHCLLVALQLNLPVIEHIVKMKTSSDIFLLAAGRCFC
jgi:hypothetical protein